MHLFLPTLLAVGLHFKYNFYVFTPKLYIINEFYFTDKKKTKELSLVFFEISEVVFYHNILVGFPLTILLLY